jgi:hypothetical protein
MKTITIAQFVDLVRSEALSRAQLESAVHQLDARRVRVKRLINEILEDPGLGGHDPYQELEDLETLLFTLDDVLVMTSIAALNAPARPRTGYARVVVSRDLLDAASGRWPLEVSTGPRSLREYLETILGVGYQA